MADTPKPHPSIPSNYVTVLELRERWLSKQKLEKETEHRLKMKISDSGHGKPKQVAQNALTFNNNGGNVDDDRVLVNLNSRYQKSGLHTNPKLKNQGLNTRYFHGVRGRAPMAYRAVNVENWKGKGCQVGDGVKIEAEVDGVDHLKNDLMGKCANRTAGKGAIRKESQKVKMINGVARNVFPGKRNSEREERVIVMEKRSWGPRVNVLKYGEKKGGEGEEKVGVMSEGDVKVEEVSVMKKGKRSGVGRIREDKETPGGEKLNGGAGVITKQVSGNSVVRKRVEEKRNSIVEERMLVTVNQNVDPNEECKEEIEVNVKEVSVLENGGKFEAKVNEGGWRGYQRYGRGDRWGYGRFTRDEGLMWVKKNEVSQNKAS